MQDQWNQRFAGPEHKYGTAPNAFLRAQAARLAPGASVLVPGVPTMAESGVPNMVMPSYIAVLGPAGMPRDVVQKLHDGYSKALHTPEITRRLAEMGVDVLAGSPDELTKLMPREISKWAAVVKSSGAKAE